MGTVPEDLPPWGAASIPHSRADAAAPPVVPPSPGQVAETVATFARERPYTAVAAAAGVGWVLAAGLPSWVVRAAIRTGTRAVVAAAVTEVVNQLGSNER